MDKKLKHLLHLYGEAPPPDVMSDADREEAQALAEMKGLLDERPRYSPPESVIRDVLTVCRAESNTARGRTDRRAHRGMSRARRFVRGGSVALALLLAGLVTLWSLDGTVDHERQAVQPLAESSVERPAEPPADVLVADRQSSGIEDAATPAAASGERLQIAEPEAMAHRPPVQVASASAAPTPGVDPALAGLGWDDTDALHDVHRMITVVQSRGADIEWDEPAVPLELLGQPGQSQRSPVRQAGFSPGPERP